MILEECSWSRRNYQLLGALLLRRGNKLNSTFLALYLLTDSLHPLCLSLVTFFHQSSGFTLCQTSAWSLTTTRPPWQSLDWVIALTSFGSFTCQKKKVSPHQFSRRTFDSVKLQSCCSYQSYKQVPGVSLGLERREFRGCLVIVTPVHTWPDTWHESGEKKISNISQ